MMYPNGVGIYTGRGRLSAGENVQIALHAYHEFDITQCASVKPIMVSGSGEDEEESSESSSGSDGDDEEDGEKVSWHICHSHQHITHTRLYGLECW